MRIIFLVEERSMEALLNCLLPAVLPENIGFLVIPHEGKSDLQASIPRKIKGWNEPGVRFVVVHDQDSADCIQLKEKLVNLCSKGKKRVLVRIACVELESWYLGDWPALSKAYDKPELKNLAQKSKFRVPDKVQNPKNELKKILPEHQQIAGARRIGPMMDLEHNQSESFNQFLTGVRQLADEMLKESSIN